MANDFTLLPYARPGLMSTASAAANATRLNLSFSARAKINGVAQGGAVSLGAQLRGPGDVIGFDSAMVVASDPDARSSAFEANYFPYVEFGSADFPWRFSLDLGVSDGRMQPWIALVVLQADEFELLPPANDLPGAIRVFNPSQSLPPVADCVYAAHVHMDGAPTGAGAIASAVADGTIGTRSRLLAARKLEESTAYTMFIVPTYELGRLAGLGDTPTTNPSDAGAWTQSVGAVDLPYYWSRRFVTNSGEDVEAMLRRLRAINAADNAAIGAQDRIFAGDPGHYQGYNNPSAEFSRQSATKDPGGPAVGFTTDANLVPKLATTLTTAIAGEAIDDTRAAADLGQAVEDPLVTFPAYGFRYREEPGVDAAKKDKYWFNHVNLDLQFRDAAARGADIVRRYQDHYMELSWQQYDGIVEANARLARLQAAKQLADNLAARRLSKLNPAVTLALAEPVWSVSKSSAITVQEAIESGGAPSSYAGRAMRRLAAKRQRAPVTDASANAPRAIPTPSLPGDRDAAGFTVVKRNQAALKKQAHGVEAISADVKKTLGELMGPDYLKAIIPVTGAIAVTAVSTKTLAKPVADLMVALPQAKALATITGLSEQETRTINPVYRGPVISDPLADRLRTVSIDALIPGLRSMPDNTVTFLEENRAFIEAFMVGANHEMNAELRWRGFPTDMRSTVFQRFWQRGRAADDAMGNDIDPIHGWTKALGKNPSSSDSDMQENLVMVIKGDIIRKIGLPIIEINIAAGQDWQAGSGQVFRPTFFGLAADAAYFGFDVARTTILAPANRNKSFLVIYEPPGRMRFGLDVGTQARRIAVRDEAKVRRPFPIAKLGLARSYSHEPVHNAPATGGTSFSTWDDFSWSHVTQHPSGYVNFANSLQPSSGPALWGAAKTGATIARSFWQKPIAAVLPLARVL